MKIAILSDAHGNYLGFNRVLTHLKSRNNIDAIYFLGDAVGYMPDINKVIDRLRKEKITCLMGNHEALLLNLLTASKNSEEVYKLTEARKNISEENLTFIKQWPSSNTLVTDKYKILMVHGSPADNLTGYIYPNTDLSVLATEKYDFIFMGHTHRPFIQKEKDITWVNVGSCGLPRDTGYLVSYALFDTETGTVSLFRLPVDVNVILDTYKDQIHSSVIDCLMRVSKDPVFGQIETA